jgi:hypothetical protein
VIGIYLFDGFKIIETIGGGSAGANTISFGITIGGGGGGGDGGDGGDGSGADASNTEFALTIFSSVKLTTT